MLHVEPLELASGWKPGGAFSGGENPRRASEWETRCRSMACQMASPRTSRGSAHHTCWGPPGVGVRPVAVVRGRPQFRVRQAARQALPTGAHAVAVCASLDYRCGARPWLYVAELAAFETSLTALRTTTDSQFTKRAARGRETCAPRRRSKSPRPGTAPLQRWCSSLQPLPLQRRACAGRQSEFGRRGAGSWVGEARFVV